MCTAKTHGHHGDPGTKRQQKCSGVKSSHLPVSAAMSLGKNNNACALGQLLLAALKELLHIQLFYVQVGSQVHIRSVERYAERPLPNSEANVGDGKRTHAVYVKKRGVVNHEDARLGDVVLRQAVTGQRRDGPKQPEDDPAVDPNK